jgi:Zn-dependent protease with chaperone function
MSDETPNPSSDEPLKHSADGDADVEDVAASANGGSVRIRCKYCGQINGVRAALSEKLAGVRCGRCRMPLGVERHHKFSKLSPHSYIHPLDSQALRTLQRIPGIDPILKKVLEVTGESYLRVMFSANGVRVSEKQCPDLYAKLDIVCRTLGIEKPELYLSVTNPMGGGGLGFNAFTSGVERPFIVLFTPLIERLTDEEVLAVIAHEAGHIHCNHLLYKVAAELLFQAASAALGAAPLPTGVADLLKLPIRGALATWYQKAELSCDRAAQLVVQDSRVIANVMMKLAGGSMTSKVNYEEFIAQAREFDKNNEGSFIDRFWTSIIASGRTHPFPIWRVSEILKWTEDPEGYQKLVSPTSLAA